MERTNQMTKVNLPLYTWLACTSLITAILDSPTPGDVVINEIFYHAPDDLTDLEYIELLNAAAESVDLSGWKIEQLAVTLEPEVRLRARLRGEDQDAAADDLRRTTGSLLQHLVEWRVFAQDEVRKNLDDGSTSKDQ